MIILTSEGTLILGNSSLKVCFVVSVKSSLDTVLQGVGGRGAILITSRHEGTKMLFGSQLIKLPPMSDSEGIDLLLCAKTDEEKPNFQEDAQILVTRLGGLPLAIEQASAYINHYKMDLSKLELEYESRICDVLKYTPDHTLPYQSNWPLSQYETYATAFTTWETPFQQIFPEDPHKQDYVTHFLCICAFLNPESISEFVFADNWMNNFDTKISWAHLFVTSPDDISDTSSSDDSSDDDCFSDYDSDQDSEPYSLLDSGNDLQLQKVPRSFIDTDSTSFIEGKAWSSTAYWKVVRRLEELSLVEVANPRVEESMTNISIHPVVRDWLQLRLERWKRRSYIQEVTDLLVDAIEHKSSTSTASKVKSEILAHIDVCIANDRRLCKDDTTLAYTSYSGGGASFAAFYRQQGRYKSSCELYRTLQKSMDASLRKKDPVRLSNMECLAIVLEERGQYKEAEKLLLQLYDLRHPHSKVRGKTRSKALSATGDIGFISNHLGQPNEAAALRRKALDICTRVEDKKHQLTIRCMQNLVLALENLSGCRAAIGLCEKSLRSCSKASGKDHPDHLTTLGIIASVLDCLGRFKRAEHLYRSISDAHLKKRGKEHPATLRSMNNLALILNKLGKHHEAEELLRRALHASAKTQSKECSLSLRIEDTLAVVLREQGRSEEAEEFE
jgi:tetratricopeptide (TPR) repeat protein